MVDVVFPFALFLAVQTPFFTEEAAKDRRFGDDALCLYFCILDRTCIRHPDFSFILSELELTRSARVFDLR